MSQDREIVTVAIGGFGVLAATQWANGLSRFEVENSSCTFQELNRRQNSTQSNKALRAVFLDQSHPSSIRDEQPLDVVDRSLETINMDPNIDVMAVFSRNNGKKSSSSNRRGALMWPKESAATKWRRGNFDAEDDDDEDDEEEEEDNENVDEQQQQAQRNVKTGTAGNNDDSCSSDDGENNDERTDPTTAVSRAIARQARRPPQAASAHHQPWWQFLTAPHHPELSRVVSFADFPHATTNGGWSQLRSFGFGLYEQEVHSFIEHRTSFVDNLRKEVESCDRMQGIQLFVDADSAFGGYATHLVSHVIADEFGIRRCFANACFPDPGEDDQGETAAAAQSGEKKLSKKQQREQQLFGGQETGAVGHGALLPETLELLQEDYRNLNRGLSTSLLSQACAGYVPHEIVSWAGLFRDTSPSVLPGLTTTDDVATASIVANWADTVLLPSRGVVIAGDKTENDAVAVSSSNEAASASVTGRGTFDLATFMGLLRPSPTLRIAAAFHALPFLSSDPMHAVPNSAGFGGGGPDSTGNSNNGYNSTDPRTKQRNSGEDPNSSLPLLLFNILDSSAPLLNFNRGMFKPLSGIIVDPSLTDTRAHAVVAHSYCIRAGLPFAEDRAAMREALTRYSLPLRSPAFVGFAVREPSPISGTFPRRIFVSQEEQKKSQQQQQQQVPVSDHVQRVNSLRTMSCGAHAVTTHAAGQYLHTVFQGSQRKAMNLRGEHVRSAMSVDTDSWRELEEDLAALRDAYDFEDPAHQQQEVSDDE